MVFTTIQKFMPEKGEKMTALSHRSPYDLIDGLVRNLRDALPNASFIGFTGTPIEQNDANTRAIFGDSILPIYYESRIAKQPSNQAELPKIDEEFDDITEEDARKLKPKTQWAGLEAVTCG